MVTLSSVMRASRSRVDNSVASSKPMSPPFTGPPGLIPTTIRVDNPVAPSKPVSPPFIRPARTDPHHGFAACDLPLIDGNRAQGAQRDGIGLRAACTHARNKLGPSFRPDLHTARGDLCCSTSLASRFPSRVGLKDENKPVAPESVKKTWGFQVAVIAPQETNNRAFGLRELQRREIDGVEDKDQFGRWFDHRAESRGRCESLQAGRCREE